MRRPLAWAALFTALAMGSPAVGQMTLDEARQEGKALGTEKRNDSTLVPSSDAQAAAVPGYSGTSLPEGSYFDDPEKLEAAAQSTKSSNEQYRITTDADRTRATFSNSEILSTTARATSVENDPSTYLAGEEMGGSKGTCVPLPATTGSAGYYETSCNAGSKVEQSAPVCRTPQVVNVTPGTTKFIYSCENWATSAAQGNNNVGWRCVPAFNAAVQNGICRERSREAVFYSICRQGNPRFCTEPDIEEGEIITYECDSPDIARPYTEETSGQITQEYRNETTCNAATAGQTCELEAETCVDPEPTTRTIDGVAVTRACWNWERTYSCHRVSQGNDCGDLEANGSCTYLRTECLDEEPDGGPCKVENRVYKCPTPSGGTTDAPQYICGDDVYCINGDCEPIVREASTEFKDALVALHSIDQAGKEFDETNFTVFKGSRETCHKPVFGLINCCAGKTSGLLTVGAGAAALAGGPTAIAALATPFLTLFACSQDEMKLDIKDRMGLCHNLGTYCSSSFLGICKTRRTAYCCFESKLSRVLQEQGRPQLGKAWGSAKKEQCLGFTIDEFSRLDLSVMDFTEVYADFMDAAKLPDEVQTMTEIQQKIQNYYDLHGK